MCSCIQTGKVFHGGGFRDCHRPRHRLATCLKNKEMWTKKTLCFGVELEKKNVTRYIMRDFSKNCRVIRCIVLHIDGGAVQKILDQSTRENNSDDLEPRLQTSATKSRCLETRKLLCLCLTSENTKESIAGGGLSA